MPTFDAAGNAVSDQPAWRVTALRTAIPYFGISVPVVINAMAQGSFRNTEAGELRVFEDGVPAELG